MTPLLIPDPIRAALEEGAALVVSVSGGKDSHALLSVCCRLHREHRWPGELVALHADLGRAEWAETPAFVAQLAARYQVPLHVVRWKGGDLLDRMEHRRLQKEATGEVFWPSSAARYCTSDLKTKPMDSWVLNRYDHVVCAWGVRAQESARRAQKPWFQKHKGIAGKRWLQADTGAGRRAWIWNTLFPWHLADVWAEIGVRPVDLLRRQQLYREGNPPAALDGWPAHPAYVYGNERLSCMYCIFGSPNDLRNAAQHNPALARWYVERELRSGFTFQHGRSLGQLIGLDELVRKELTDGASGGREPGGAGAGERPGVCRADLRAGRAADAGEDCLAAGGPAASVLAEEHRLLRPRPHQPTLF